MHICVLCAACCTLALHDPIDTGPRMHACALQTAEIVLENHPNVELEAVEALRERVRVCASHRV